MASQDANEYAEEQSPAVWNIMPTNGKWNSDIEDELSEKIFDTVAQAYDDGMAEAIRLFKMAFTYLNIDLKD